MNVMILNSPLGPLTVAETPEGKLAHLRVGRSPEPDWTSVDRLQSSVAQQLAEYFGGRRRHFELPLELKGTPFQQLVWQALTKIPFGQTVSYGLLARELGRPGAARAVGAANGANPVAIIVPCHRVVGADGRLTGYAYGLESKAHLLNLEQGHLAEEQSRPGG